MYQAAAGSSGSLKNSALSLDAFIRLGLIVYLALPGTNEALPRHDESGLHAAESLCVPQSCLLTLRHRPPTAY